MAWLNDETTRATQAFRHDSNGSIWVRAYAPAGATKLTPISICYGQNGWHASAITNTSDVQMLQYVGVPKATYGSGVFGWYQIGGYCSSVITANTTGTIAQGLKLASDIITTTGASAGAAAGVNDNQFAVFTVTEVAATSHNILLFPYRIDGAD
jgi:hypothetical protein